MSAGQVGASLRASRVGAHWKIMIASGFGLAQSCTRSGLGVKLDPTCPSPSPVYSGERVAREPAKNPQAWGDRGRRWIPSARSAVLMAGRMRGQAVLQAESKDGEENRPFRLRAFLAKLEQMPVSPLCSCGLTFRVKVREGSRAAAAASHKSNPTRFIDDGIGRFPPLVYLASWCS